MYAQHVKHRRAYRVGSIIFLFKSSTNKNLVATLFDARLFTMLSTCVGHSPQTRSIAPAATFVRVRLRNFFLGKRPSFLVSRRFACENPTPCSNYFGQFPLIWRATLEDVSLIGSWLSFCHVICSYLISFSIEHRNHSCHCPNLLNQRSITGSLSIRLWTKNFSRFATSKLPCADPVCE